MPLRRARWAGRLGVAVAVLVARARARATIGFDRDLLYLLTFALFASVGAHARADDLGGARRRPRDGRRRRARAASRASRQTCSRRRPIRRPSGRLAYPLTYWNALGVFCAVAGGPLPAPRGGRRAPQSSACSRPAPLPVIGTTLLLTYSRGGLAVAVVGVVALRACSGGPRGLLSALIAARAGDGGRDQGRLRRHAALERQPDDAGRRPPGPPARARGARLRRVAPSLLRALLLLVDRVLEGERSPIDRHHRGAALRGAVGAVVVAVVVARRAGRARRDRRTAGTSSSTSRPVDQGPLARSRLSSTSNNGRIELWTVAMDAFSAHPLDGTGAETFEILWYEHRNQATVVVNAHSLYIETLAELGRRRLGVRGAVRARHAGRARPARARPRPRPVCRAVRRRRSPGRSMPASTGTGRCRPCRCGSPRSAASRWGGRELARERKRAACRPRVGPSSSGAVVVGACVFPALVLASQVRLNEATSGVRGGDCARADQLRAALDRRPRDARAAVADRGALRVRAGRYRRRRRRSCAADSAVDPDDWQLESALAAAIAADRRGRARGRRRGALRLNPLDPSVQALAKALGHGSVAQARRAPRSTFLSEQSLIESG